MGTVREKSDDEYSVIGEKTEIGFMDYQDESSIISYNPVHEGPIKISIPFPFQNEKPQSIISGEIAVDSVTINNTTSEAISLWTKIVSSNPEDSFTLSLMKPPSGNSDEEESEGFMDFFDLEDRMVQPGEILTIWVSCKPKEIGMHQTVVSFDFEGEYRERTIHLLADDKISKSLMSQKPYSKGIRKKNFPVDNGFVAGTRPARKMDHRVFKTRLPLYKIPNDLREIIESKQIPDIVFEGLTRENYAAYFKTLLVMEEIQLEDDMRSHNMENVSMKRKGNFLTLVVPGLAERRPSLVHGDYIFAKNVLDAGDDTTRPFQGFIHRVEADEVHLQFSNDFHLHHQDRNLYDVVFTYNRINTRRLYQAADSAQHLETEFLFPAEAYSGKRVIQTKPLVPVSTLLNEEQIGAIEKILGCKGAPPYLIYGPPGTGKTMTVVEAIIQLYTTRRDAKILVCAPSNSAADYILEKILSQPVRIEERDILRLNATTRPFEEVKPELLPFCSFQDTTFNVPPFNCLSNCRIIVSTYMSASILNAEGVRRGHFSHIFLDEAGQATEPESMISIAHLSLQKTVVVLAGDPMQLGPVIYSKVSEVSGFEKSYLERLFESEYYRSGNENYMTKLVRNYRCHAEILYLPSMLFYNGELVACRDNTSSFLNSMDFLPNRDFPVLFNGIQGCDEREGNNPSWFNRIEASKVVETIQELLDGGNLTEQDIGVITPYRQQVLKIKRALEFLDLTGITVGSVEQFQGQERQVIIVSTVRSTVKHNDFDKAHCLGFLSNPKRFNVAITRAISLLVIIGNPHIIHKDNYWNMLLWRCVDNNSYKGCLLPERKEGVLEYPYHQGNENQYPYGGAENDEPQSYGGGEWDQEQTHGAGEWDQEPLADISKAVTDEAEWSDGWK